MKKQLLVLVSMGALALGASAQTAITRTHAVGPNIQKVGPNAHASKAASAVQANADLTKKVGPNAIRPAGDVTRVDPNAIKVGPITRK